MFHWECPVTPHRFTSLDTVGNMEQGVDCDWTCRYVACVMLIVKSEDNRVSAAMITIQTHKT